MSTLDVLTPPGTVSKTTGTLLKLNRATAGRGQEGFCMDLRARFDALTDDAETLAKLVPGTAELYGKNRRWDGKIEAILCQTATFVIVGLEGKPIIAGKGTISKAALICRGISRSLEVWARLEVPEKYEAPVYQVGQAVTVQLMGVEQPAAKPKGAKGKKPAASTVAGQTNIVFGHRIDASAVPKVAALVIPEPGQIVEVRTGTKTTRWALVHQVIELGQDTEVVLKDIADGRAKERLPVGFIAKAVAVVAPDDTKLQGAINRHRSKVNKTRHGKPASWTYIMRAWENGGKSQDGARLIDGDVLDRAAELLVAEAKMTDMQNRQCGTDVPDPADDELPAATAEG